MIEHSVFAAMGDYKRVTRSEWHALVARVSEIERLQGVASRNIKTFTVVTPTGDRPEAFALCCKYIQRQTRQPDAWIVVDDGATSTLAPDLPYLKYVQRDRTRDIEGQHTLPVQLLEALNHVRTDAILIMEDDDWYAPDYCEKMLAMFEEHSRPLLVGQGQTVYYNVKVRKYFVHYNRAHASLQQTAFHVALADDLRKLCKRCYTRNDPYVDLRMWRTFGCKKSLLLDATYSSIGIKGMPGRLGTCSGHVNTAPFKQDTPKMDRLRGWIGNDVENYLRYAE